MFKWMMYLAPALVGGHFNRNVCSCVWVCVVRAAHCVQSLALKPTHSIYADELCWWDGGSHLLCMCLFLFIYYFCNCFGCYVTGYEGFLPNNPSPQPNVKATFHLLKTWLQPHKFQQINLWPWSQSAASRRSVQHVWSCQQSNKATCFSKVGIFFFIDAWQFWFLELCSMPEYNLCLPALSRSLKMLHCTVTLIIMITLSIY